MTQINSGAGVTARLAFFVIFHFTSLFLLTKVFSEPSRTRTLFTLTLLKWQETQFFVFMGTKSAFKIKPDILCEYWKKLDIS